MALHHLDQDNFNTLMDAFRPFERAPHIAVGVSGGADSMALAVLLSGWARQHGGQITALIVDHGIRPDSGTEAKAVAETISSLGLDNEILTWTPDDLISGIQSKAREARYRLMEDWCRRQSVLHLAIAHHADDQAETVLMRMQKGSGPDGLAGIPNVRELRHCRIIRPLLDVRKQALVNVLKHRGISWVHDPSNDDPKYTRTLIRTGIESDAIDIDGVAKSAMRYARVRQAAEAQAAQWLARYADVRPSGYLKLDRDALFDASADTRLRVLSRAASVIGGKAYAPAISATERLENKLADGKTTTLSGTLFVNRAGSLFAFRERRNLPSAHALKGTETLWDGRFRISVQDEIVGAEIVAFGDAKHCTQQDVDVPGWFSDLPVPAQRTFPVISLANNVLMPEPDGPKKAGISLRFAPKIPLVGMGFYVA